MRAADLYQRQRSDWRSPGSRARSVRTCQGLGPRRVGATLAITRSAALLPLFGQRRHPGWHAIAAQWLARTLPYRRFADTLADACARLGADAVRYSFIAVDFHNLLLAGLPAHLLKNSKLR